MKNTFARVSASRTWTSRLRVYHLLCADVGLSLCQLTLSIQDCIMLKLKALKNILI